MSGWIGLITLTRDVGIDHRPTTERQATSLSCDGHNANINDAAMFRQVVFARTDAIRGRVSTQHTLTPVPTRITSVFRLIYTGCHSTVHVTCIT